MSSDNVNKYLDRLVAAKGDEEKVRSATLQFKRDVKRTHKAALDLARDKELPADWTFVISGKNIDITSPEGLHFRSIRGANQYIAFCETEKNVAKRNAFACGFPDGWQLFRGEYCKKWRCVSPGGQEFSETAARKHLKSSREKDETESTPADASSSTVLTRSAVLTRSTVLTQFTVGATSSRKSANRSTTGGLSEVKKNLFNGNTYVSMTEHERVIDQMQVQMQELQVCQIYYFC
jgi:hypothetical protein